MKDWLLTYGAEDVICFFKSLGVVVKSEDGYIYPVSGQAKTVVDALTAEIKRLGVNVIYKEQLKAVDALDGGRLLALEAINESIDVLSNLIGSEGNLA